MNSRWFNTAVVVLWLATMSWLVTTKVLPPWRYGEPPSYRQIVEAENRDPPVGWEVSLGGQRLGWALTDTKMRATGLTAVHGRVHFDTMPLDAVIPGWLQPVSRFIGKPADQLRMDASTELGIDTFGHLFRFDSCVRLDPLDREVTMQGSVEKGQLKLTVRSGKLSFSHEISLPPKALLADTLSPQSRLPGLHVGQTWSVPVINPLGWDKSPIEIIGATVEEPEPISWNGAVVNAWRVVYRNDSGSGDNGQAPKGTLWVRSDGAVLQQQTTFINSTLLFVRLSDETTARIVAAAGKRWWTIGGSRRQKNHD